MRAAPEITLTMKERKMLEKIRRSRSVPVRLRERAAIVLLPADGWESKAIAARPGEYKMKVGRWRARYAKAGFAGISKDKSRPGRIPPVPAVLCSRIVRMTLAEQPPGATHWSRTPMAKVTSVSPSSVGRIWKVTGVEIGQPSDIVSVVYGG